MRDARCAIRDSPDCPVANTHCPDAASWRRAVPRMSLSPLLVTPGHTGCTPPGGGCRMNGLRDDLRHALRVFWNAPSFAAAAVLTLALGIGVNIAVFTVMHSALFAALPVKHAKELVIVFTWAPKGGDHEDFSYPLYVDLREAAGQTRTGSPAYTVDGRRRGGRLADRARHHRSRDRQLLSSSSASTCARGPGFSGADERQGAAPVAVISQRLWQSMFNGDAAAIGRPLQVNGLAVTVVGIAPASFTGFTRGRRVDLWVPVSQYFMLDRSRDRFGSRESSWLSLVGRTGPVRRSSRSHSAMTAAMRAHQSREDAEAGWTVRSRRGRRRGHLVGGRSRPPAAAADARGRADPPHRDGERGESAAHPGLHAAAGDRDADGARRQPLAHRPPAADRRGGAVLRRRGPRPPAGRLDRGGLRPPHLVGGAVLTLAMEPDLAVVAFAAAVSTLAAVAIGILPAFGASRADLSRGPQGSGEAVSGAVGKRRARMTLTVVQIALSLVLVVGAGLFLRSLGKLRSIDPSLVTDRVVAAQMDLTLRGTTRRRACSSTPRCSRRARTARRAGGDPDQRAARHRRRHAGKPARRRHHSQSGRARRVRYRQVSPGYFATLGVPLVAGRDFSSADTARAPRSPSSTSRCSGCSGLAPIRWGAHSAPASPCLIPWSASRAIPSTATCARSRAW